MLIDCGREEMCTWSLLLGDIEGHELDKTPTRSFSTRSNTCFKAETRRKVDFVNGISSLEKIDLQCVSHSEAEMLSCSSSLRIALAPAFLAEICSTKLRQYNYIRIKTDIFKSQNALFMELKFPCMTADMKALVFIMDFHGNLSKFQRYY